MEKKSKHSPERRRFFSTSAKVAGGALLLSGQSAQADQSSLSNEDEKKPKGYQADSDQVKKYYQRARF